jgi:hypothetical protein
MFQRRLSSFCKKALTDDADIYLLVSERFDGVLSPAIISIMPFELREVTLQVIREVLDDRLRLLERVGYIAHLHGLENTPIVGPFASATYENSKLFGQWLTPAMDWFSLDRELQEVEAKIASIS